MFQIVMNAPEHRARRERLGLSQARPVVSYRPPPAPTPEPIVRDVIVLDVKPVIDMPKAEIIDYGDGISMPSIPKWRGIALEVCKKHGIKFTDLCSDRRDRKAVSARHEAAYRMRNETTLSLPQIGKRLGGKDHTSILYGINRHEARLAGEVYHKKRYVSTANKEMQND